MTAKKYKHVDISLSSSDSGDDECNKYEHLRKKKKVTGKTNIAHEWIKPHNSLATTPRMEESVVISETDSNESPDISETSSPEIENTTNGSFIVNTKLPELSPVPYQNLNHNLPENDSSPILGSSMAILMEMRSKYRKKRAIRAEVHKSLKDSPELFSSQSSQVIDSDSPEFFNKNSPCTTDPDSSESSQNIEEIPSQSSQITNLEPDINAFKHDSNLYYLPRPKKKNFKKGGLAWLLQKALHLRKTRFQIWQHEIYTNKYDGTFDEGKIIKFTLQKKWIEYGCVMLECEMVDEGADNSSNIVLSDNTDSFFIIIVAPDVSLKNTYTVNCKYKLFPPYETKDINYKLKTVPCYFNVTRLVLLK